MLINENPKNVNYWGQVSTRGISHLFRLLVYLEVVVTCVDIEYVGQHLRVVVVGVLLVAVGGRQQEVLQRN